VPTLAPTFTPPARTLPVIYDDDGSPDGTAALFYLLSHPEVSLQAIGISYGEAYPASYIQHIGGKLDELGIESAPLGAGHDSPLAGDNEFPEWMREAAEDFWGLPRQSSDKTYPSQDAAELIASTVSGSPEPVTIFISGPSTNLAQALRLDPVIRENIAAVYIMGGAVGVPGNIDDLIPDSPNLVAEWNVFADPQAAQEVFESGLDIFLVPLDATNQVTITREDTGRWRSGGGTADFAAEVYDMMLNSWAGMEAPSWDLMTAAILARPGLCAFQPLALEVDTGEGTTSGQTAEVEGGSTVQVCLEPDVEGIKEELAAVFSQSR
jgi:inosine-uridine nucleoside N-ribohydrolase